MRAISSVFLCVWASASLAQGGSPELAKPPADAAFFTILSTAGRHGRSARWTDDHGQKCARETMLLRGQSFDTDSISHVGGDHMLNRMTVDGVTPSGDAHESFSIAGGEAHWKSPVDAGAAHYSKPAMYVPFGGPIDLTADLVEALVAAPGQTLALLPGGSAQAEKLTALPVGDGAMRKIVTAYAVTGLFNTPVAVWVDARGAFFGKIGRLAWLPVGYENTFDTLLRAQDDALAKRSALLAQRLVKVSAGPVAFTNVRAFVDGTHFAAMQTVVVDHRLIIAVGPAGSTAIPAGAQVIDGSGKTLVPGLWDAHMHFGDDSTGPMLLSLGVTSVRDPGGITSLTLARASRRARGQLLSPRVYPSMMIDGRGPNTAQVGEVAESQAEALAIVRRAKSEGFIAIKLYGSFPSAWVTATAAEAHRLGMHVHGHLPAGMRTLDAINAGYDEITHIYFVTMQAMPEDVVKASNGMARFNGTARFAKDIDLTSEPMKSLIAIMARRKITVDPTLVVGECLFVPENGELSPAYTPFVGTLPPAVERRFRVGGFSVPHDLTRADYRASFDKLSTLVGMMHKAGVPIVAGTDGSGLELVRELELYVTAGFTPSEALASATIQTARLVGADRRTGSIEVGKAADLVLVSGDPSTTIGDLRHTRMVMMDGDLMDADSLRAAGGFGGPPGLD